MSTVTSPSPAKTPGRQAPPAVPARKPGTWKFLVALLILSVVAWIGYQLWPSAPAPTEGTAVVAIRTAPVTSGVLERTLRVSGVTSSVVFANVRAPSQRGPEDRALIILELLPSGTRVKKGDMVARIDGQGLKDHVDDVHSTVVESETDMKKRSAEQEVDWSNLKQNIEVAKSTWDKWKHEAQAAEVRTVIDQEILNLAQEEAQVAYQERQKELEYKQAAHKAELEILELTSERHKRHRDRHAYDLERYTVESPMDGMAVRQQIFRNGEFGMAEIGDRLWPGLLFMKIMDTDNMQVEGSVNQIEGNVVKIGMEARIGLDAFPGLEFQGSVHSLGALAKSGSQNEYVRQIPIRIRIDGSHAKLIPDLSAYADVIIDRREKVTQVPLGAVVVEAGQPYVHVKKGELFEKRPVELGMKSYTHVEVISGLSVGEEIALEHPTS